MLRDAQKSLSIPEQGKEKKKDPSLYLKVFVSPQTPDHPPLAAILVVIVIVIVIVIEIAIAIAIAIAIVIAIAIAQEASC